MIGVLAELAHSIITERTRAGVKAAQKRGVELGRQLINACQRLQGVATLLSAGRVTLYRALQRTPA